MRPVEHIQDHPVLTGKPILATEPGRAYGPYARDGGWWVQDEDGIEHRLGQSVVPIAQAAHGFVVGQPVYQLADGTYAAALVTAADATRAADLVVVNVIDANNAEAASSGVFDYEADLPFTGGMYYYTSASAGIAIDTVAATNPVQRLFWAEGLRRLVVNLEPIADTGAAVQQPETISTLAARDLGPADISTAREWQTFVPGVDGTIPGGTLDLSTQGGPGPVDALVELFEGDDPATGVSLGTATITGVTAARSIYTWVSVPAVSVEVGKVYSLSAIRATGTDTLLWHTASAAYSNGQGSTVAPDDFKFEFTIAPAVSQPIYIPFTTDNGVLPKTVRNKVDIADGSVLLPADGEIAENEFVRGVNASTTSLIVQAQGANQLIDAKTGGIVAQVALIGGATFEFIRQADGSYIYYTTAPEQELPFVNSLHAVTYMSTANLDLVAVTAAATPAAKWAIISAALDRKETDGSLVSIPGSAWRIGLKEQTDKIQNGVYEAKSNGDVVRFNDFQSGASIPIRTWHFVRKGQNHQNEVWQMYNDTVAMTDIIVDTHEIRYNLVTSPSGTVGIDGIRQLGAAVGLDIYQPVTVAGADLESNTPQRIEVTTAVAPDTLAENEWFAGINTSGSQLTISRAGTNQFLSADGSLSDTVTVEHGETYTLLKLADGNHLFVSSALQVVFPGDLGTVQIGRENDYYLDETVGATPAATVGREYAIGIIQANSTDAQAVKDAATVQVTHARGVDTGAGPVWLLTENQSAAGAHTHEVLENIAVHVRSAGTNAASSVDIELLIDGAWNPTDWVVSTTPVTGLESYTAHGPVHYDKAAVTGPIGIGHNKDGWLFFEYVGDSTEGQFTGINYTGANGANSDGEIIVNFAGTNQHIDFADKASVVATDLGFEQAAETTPAKNALVYSVGNFTALAVNDSGTGADGAVYKLPTVDALQITLPNKADMNAAEGIYRVRISGDWAALSTQTTVLSFIDNTANGVDMGTGLPDDGNEWLDLVFDAANDKWIATSGGDVTLTQVIPTYTVHTEVPANIRLYLIDGTGASAEGLYRKETVGDAPNHIG